MRALVLLLSAALACTPDFAAQSDVSDLRVLAVQAEPPEAQYDAASVDPVHLRILAVDPPRKNNFALMKWDICAPTDSRRCLNGPIVPQASGSQTRTGGNEFSADIAIPPGVVQALVGNDKLGGFLDTFRAQFSFSVSDGDPNDAVDAALLDLVKAAPWTGEYDLLTGLAGIGVYAVERLPRPRAYDVLAAVVARRGSGDRRPISARRRVANVPVRRGEPAQLPPPGGHGRDGAAHRRWRAAPVRHPPGYR